MRYSYFTSNIGKILRVLSHVSSFSAVLVRSILAGGHLNIWKYTASCYEKPCDTVNLHLESRETLP